jgi:hypothetical protein
VPDDELQFPAGLLDERCQPAVEMVEEKEEGRLESVRKRRCLQKREQMRTH